MACDWQQVQLGATGLAVTPLGVASSYGLGASDVERAFERGLNYFYWGSNRTKPFGDGLRAIIGKDRARLKLVVQTYSRVGHFVGHSLQRALKALRTDYTDVLLLGWWNQPPPRRILDAALELKAKGLARAIMISCHDRRTFATYLDDPAYDALMVRYNAAHPGAEQEVFPLLERRKVGIVAYTATRWGGLLDEKLTVEPPPRASDCYRFALSNPAVNVVVCGPSNGAQLDEAMTALDRGPLSTEERERLLRVGANVKKNASVTGRGAPLQFLDRVNALFAGTGKTD